MLLKCCNGQVTQGEGFMSVDSKSIQATGSSYCPQPCSGGQQPQLICNSWSFQCPNQPTINGDVTIVNNHYYGDSAPAVKQEDEIKYNCTYIGRNFLHEVEEYNKYAECLVGNDDCRAEALDYPISSDEVQSIQKGVCLLVIKQSATVTASATAFAAVAGANTTEQAPTDPSSSQAELQSAQQIGLDLPPPSTLMPDATPTADLNTSADENLPQNQDDQTQTNNITEPLTEDQPLSGQIFVESEPESAVESSDTLSSDALGGLQDGNLIGVGDVQSGPLYGASDEQLGIPDQGIDENAIGDAQSVDTINAADAPLTGAIVTQGIAGDVQLSGDAQTGAAELPQATIPDANSDQSNETEAYYETNIGVEYVPLDYYAFAPDYYEYDAIAPRDDVFTLPQYSGDTVPVSGAYGMYGTMAPGETQDTLGVVQSNELVQLQDQPPAYTHDGSYPCPPGVKLDTTGTRSPPQSTENAEFSDEMIEYLTNLQKTEVPKSPSPPPATFDFPTLGQDNNGPGHYIGHYARPHVAEPTDELSTYPSPPVYGSQNEDEIYDYGYQEGIYENAFYVSFRVYGIYPSPQYPPPPPYGNPPLPPVAIPPPPAAAQDNSQPSFTLTQTGTKEVEKSAIFDQTDQSIVQIEVGSTGEAEVKAMVSSSVDGPPMAESQRIQLTQGDGALQVAQSTQNMVLQNVNQTGIDQTDDLSYNGIAPEPSYYYDYDNQPQNGIAEDVIPQLQQQQQVQEVQNQQVLSQSQELSDSAMVNDLEPFACLSDSNCLICHEEGCSQCKDGYFKTTQDSECIGCKESFGDDCLFCNNYFGCAQCSSTTAQVLNEEQNLWECQPCDLEGCEATGCGVSNSTDIYCRQCQQGYVPYLDEDNLQVCGECDIPNCMFCNQMFNTVSCGQCEQGYVQMVEEGESNRVVCVAIVPESG